MKQLLILHAGQTEAGHTYALAQSARVGAAALADEVATVMLPALQAGLPDLLAAQGLLLVTPEKFGYMAGALKDFFDRTFYPAQGRIAGLPYALVVVGGNDGSGAVLAVERIARGYPLKAIAEPLVVKGAPTETQLQQACELGEAMAGGIAMGIF